MEIKFIKGEESVLRGHLCKFLNLKNVLSNYYSTSDLSETEFFLTENSIFLRKKFDDFFRIYLITININETKDILKNLKGRVAINIPSKIEIKNWEILLNAADFNLLGVYERYYNSTTESKENFTARYAESNHFDTIRHIIYSNFNPITDWLPLDCELNRMIENNQILVNIRNNELKGFIIFTFMGKKCYFNCWYDKSGDGMYLLYNVYALMKMNNVSYAYFWINSKNTIVKKIHSLHGFRPDGLKDYTFYKQN